MMKKWDLVFEFLKCLRIGASPFCGRVLWGSESKCKCQPQVDRTWNFPINLAGQSLRKQGQSIQQFTKASVHYLLKVRGQTLLWQSGGLGRHISLGRKRQRRADDIDLWWQQGQKTVLRILGHFLPSFSSQEDFLFLTQGVRKMEP